MDGKGGPGWSAKGLMGAEYLEFMIGLVDNNLLYYVLIFLHVDMESK